jgi:hypothetical protein
MEAHTNSNGGLARRPPVLPRARQGATAVGANHDRIDHGDGSCRGLDVGPERAAALYGARLGLDMALDRSHPDWGRLMFFRCGDLIVEVTHRPGKETDTSQDRLSGLCWRVSDIDATHARLIQAGVDVSEVRTGRKPGTRGDDGTQRHLRRADAAGAAIGGEAVIFPLSLWERVAPNEVRRRVRGSLHKHSAERDPSSGASRHLLQQGEKEKTSIASFSNRTLHATACRMQSPGD